MANCELLNLSDGYITTQLCCSPGNIAIDSTKANEHGDVPAMGDIFKNRVQTYFQIPPSTILNMQSCGRCSMRIFFFFFKFWDFPGGAVDEESACQ